MDQFFFHPKVVHLPMALSVLMPLVAGGAAFACWRGWFDRRVWVIVFLLQATLVGSGFIAMTTGEAEEDRVEEIVAEQYIESHEDAAELFVWASGIVLAAMVLTLALREGRLRGATVFAAVLGTLVVSVLGFRTGEAGGRLVYEHGAAEAYVQERALGAPKDQTVTRRIQEDRDDDD